MLISDICVRSEPGKVRLLCFFIVRNKLDEAWLLINVVASSKLNEAMLLINVLLRRILSNAMLVDIVHVSIADSFAFVRLAVLESAEFRTDIWLIGVIVANVPWSRRLD